MPVVQDVRVCTCLRVFHEIWLILLYLLIYLPLKWMLCSYHQVFNASSCPLCLRHTSIWYDLTTQYLRPFLHVPNLLVSQTIYHSIKNCRQKCQETTGSCTIKHGYAIFLVIFCPNPRNLPVIAGMVRGASHTSDPASPWPPVRGDGTQAPMSVASQNKPRASDSSIYWSLIDGLLDVLMMNHG